MVISDPVHQVKEAFTIEVPETIVSFKELRALKRFDSLVKIVGPVAFGIHRTIIYAKTFLSYY